MSNALRDFLKSVPELKIKQDAEVPLEAIKPEDPLGILFSQEIALENEAAEKRGYQKARNKFRVKYLNMKILALDIATNCGWAVNSNPIAFGAWDLTPRKDESKGMRLVRFRAKVAELCELEKPEMIAFEMAAGRHVHSISVESEMIGVLKLYCEERGLLYKSVTSTGVKKFATGKGNANKQYMMDMLKIRHGLDVEGDDDAADAVWILKFVENEFKYGDMRLPTGQSNKI